VAKGDLMLGPLDALDVDAILEHLPKRRHFTQSAIVKIKWHLHKRLPTQANCTTLRKLSMNLHRQVICVNQLKCRMTN